MNKRRLIAVIIGRIDQNNSNFINGITYQAELFNCNIAVFSVFSENDREFGHQKGEEFIFDLINFNRFDGVIFADFTFWPEQMRLRIIQRLSEHCKIPVVSIISELPSELNCKCVRISNRQAFYEITSHLIAEHRLTKIYCLTGFKDTYIASERLAGYLMAMRQHGIEVSDDYIFYGDLWTESAKKLAESIASGQINKPQGVVCANDIMAITLTNTLIEHGISVPGEIAVTGFDALNDSILNTPSITTYSPPEMLSGSMCLCTLLNLITGVNTYCRQPEAGHLVLNDSCGCKMSDNEFAKKAKSQILCSQQCDSRIELSNMYEKLAEAADINGLISWVDGLTYLIDGYERYFLCLNNDLLTDDTILSKKYSPYSDTITIMLDKTGFTKVCKNISFPVDEMLPALYEYSDKPDVFYFTPLHFDDKCFGYSVISFQDKYKTPDSAYRAWNKNISNAIHLLDTKGQNFTVSKIINESSECSIAPHWIFELLCKMNRKENFIQGLPQMLKLAHISQEHLTREFRKNLGITPTQYINEKRLSYAAQLLLDGNYDITDVCFMSGFNNISHFYHRFKQKYNCSPKQFIKSKKNEP